MYRPAGYSTTNLSPYWWSSQISPPSVSFTCGVRNLSHLPYGLQKLNPQVDVTCIGPFRKQYVTAMQLHRYLTSESSVLASPAQYTCFVALSTASKCPKLGTLCFASPNTSIPQNLLQLPRCLNLREKPSLLVPLSTPSLLFYSLEMRYT